MKKILWKAIDFIGWIGRKFIQLIKFVLRFLVNLFSAIGKWPQRIPPGLLTFLLGIVLLLGLVFGIYKLSALIWHSDLPLIARDAFMALYAHNKAGESIPAEIDYTRSQPYFPAFEWGQATNSEWLTDYSRLIVPYFEWEELTGRAFYPELAVWAPRLGYSSLRVGGWAWPPAYQVYMNERVLLNAIIHKDKDAGRIVATLTHELIHIQGGNFFDSPEHLGVSGSATWSQWIESHTEAATTEILAAMSFMGDINARRAFWLSIEDYARSGLKLKMIDNFGKFGWWLYDRWADMFVRDADDRLYAQKSWRYWNNHYWTMIDLLQKYGVYPWEEFVIPGVLYDIPLDTGITNCYISNGIPECKINGLLFDDTREILGWLRLLLYLGQ